MRLQAILNLRPGAEFILRGGTLEWLDTKHTQPTEQEIEDEVKLQSELCEAHHLLDSTQFKFGSDYEPKEGEDLDDLKARRKVARDFVRANKRVSNG